jgi:hypothetical protein
MSFERAQAIADAVLFEGYVLYPYRASSTKNRYRWTFGVLAPREWSEAGGCEPSWLETQVLVRGQKARLHGRLRFLHVVDRRVEARDGEGTHPVERLEVGGNVVLPWEEAELREIDFDVEVDAGHDARRIPFSVPADERTEIVRDADGTEIGLVIRSCRAVSGTIHAWSEPVDGTGEPLARVSIHVENLTPYPSRDAERADAMRASCVSTHVLLEAENGSFMSLVDAPPHAREAAAACTSVRAHPVLAGAPGQYDVMLCSPIILYDHPQVAPESPGEFFDSCEIDALLALRTKTLTPEERVLARAADGRAAALLDRVDALEDNDMARLHGGTMRDRRLVATESTGSADRAEIGPGERVRLRLTGSRRRTDAQDILYDGRCATVESVREDVDGRKYLLVTIDDDPAAEMHRWKGRFHYYYPDEVERIEGGER